MTILGKIPNFALFFFSPNVQQKYSYTSDAVEFCSCHGAVLATGNPFCSDPAAKRVVYSSVLCPELCRAVGF